MVRIKHRYLLVNILYPEPIHPKKSQTSTFPDILHFHRPTPDDLTPQLLVRAIRDQILYLYGDYGFGITSTGLLVKYLSPATSTFILRCSRANHRIVWAALSFITHLPAFAKGQGQQQGQSCVMQVVRVSGTIRKAEEELIRRARGAIVKARGESGDGGVGGILFGDDTRGGVLKGGKTGVGIGIGIGIEDDDEDEDDDDDESMDEGG
ncbi:MAG: hypothetical protein Q9202_002620 [Teloschistes flavicans]